MREWKLRYTLMTMLVAIIAGIAPTLYKAALFISQLDTFKEIRVGMPEDKAAEILADARVHCGMSIYKEHVCRFSDFWRDYDITADIDTRTISSVSYSPRAHSTVLGNLLGKGL